MKTTSYRLELVHKARALRRRSTLGERLLWKRLRRRRLGVPFRRQHPIGPFIVDFYCPAHRLVVEVDGSSHRGSEKYDLARQRYLENLGCVVLRFSNAEVAASPARVAQRIAAQMTEQ